MDPFLITLPSNPLMRGTYEAAKALPKNLLMDLFVVLVNRQEGVVW